jgi:hypothetical protein
VQPFISVLRPSSATVHVSAAIGHHQVYHLRSCYTARNSKFKNSRFHNCSCCVVNRIDIHRRSRVFFEIWDCVFLCVCRSCVGPSYLFYIYGISLVYSNVYPSFPLLQLPLRLLLFRMYVPYLECDLSIQLATK